MGQNNAGKGAGNDRKRRGKFLGELRNEHEASFVTRVGSASAAECIAFLNECDVSNEVARHRFAKVTRELLAGG